MSGLRFAVEDTGAVPPGLPRAFLAHLESESRIAGESVRDAGRANALQGIAMLVGLASLIMLFSDKSDRVAGGRRSICPLTVVARGYRVACESSEPTK